MDWGNAQWIWDGGDPAPVNGYRIFRKMFLPADTGHPTQNLARICADTRYTFYLNGRAIARGPAPSAPGLYAYDEIALDSDIRTGRENVITIVVNYIGAPTFAYCRHRGGLLFQLGDVVSDETWLVAKSSPWLADAPRLTVQQGFCEYYDARAEAVGTYGYDDIEPDEWTPPVTVCAAEGADWKTLAPRDIPLPESHYRAIATLVEWGNGTPGPGETVAEQMTTETLRPLTRGRVKRDEFENVTITPDGEDVYLLYDFGEEVSGFLDFDIEAEDGAAGGAVDIGYDEALRVGETPSGLKHDWGLNNGVRHAYADRLILRDGEQTFQNVGHRAFRYVRLAFRNLTAPVTLTSIGVYESTYPINTRGVFTCSDARLDRIWQIGRRTLQLCMDDRFMDCPWRERAQWVGDAKVEALGALYCFGDTGLHRRFLRQIALSQLPDGHTLPVGPGDWEAYSPDQPIPGFTALWIHSIGDYFQLTGDGAFCASLRPQVTAALDWFGRYGTGEGGLLADIPGWNFTDWAPGLSGGNAGLTAPVNLFYYRALQVGAELARLAGDGTQAEEWDARAARLAQAFDALFWDGARGVWADRVQEGTRSAEASQQTNSLALLYQVGSRERRDAALGRLLDDATLVQIASPYFSFYLLSALYSEGRHDEALAYIRRHWGAMLDAGATTWWEEYHGQSSLCHAWSIGPTIDLPAQFLGVTPGEPGFASVQIAPHPADLKWAKGVVPTPRGDVAVQWRHEEGRFTLHVSTPPDVSLRVILPARPGDRVTINGQPVTDTGSLTLPGGGHAFEVLAT